ncbi:hypothetical protein K443DRAFT_513176 [Laccaria amethystina LaAM-08-1]|uniref:Uncharacterized protein n=1 Tax=Laccaria amethystina LaAM-08-1 TaxID=1095629 RepID=A0A0C9WM83_9AGAR|nr:hypothetical protein K443DRAFT_513176 [Laccaria amethystina LaAM-08-1]
MNHFHRQSRGKFECCLNVAPGKSNTPILTQTFEQLDVNIRLKPPLPKCRINSFHFIPCQELEVP